MSPSKTVLYLLDYTHLGGGESSLLAHVEQMRETAPQWRAIVVLRGEGSAAEAFRAAGFDVRISPYPCRFRFGPIPWFKPLAVRQLRQLIRQEKVDLVHANNFFALVYGGAAARGEHVPAVWTCHGWFDLNTRAKNYFAKRHAQHILCVSHAVRDYVADRMRGIPVTTDHLGIRPFAKTETREDREVLRGQVRREFEVGEDTPLVGVVGRFQPIKGHQYMLEALPHIRREIPDLKVWFIGDAQPGNQEELSHKKRIRDYVRDRKLSPVVEFLGHRSDARRLMRGLDALVIPSEAESFSMVAAEGLEAGVPVVGPNGWGPSEIIREPATGLFFKPKDAEELADKVLQVLMRRADGAKFDPEAGPVVIREHFSAAAHTRRVVDVYEKTLGKHREAREKHEKLMERRKSKAEEKNTLKP